MESLLVAFIRFAGFRKGISTEIALIDEKEWPIIAR